MEKVQLFIDSWEFFGEAALSGAAAGALLGAVGVIILLSRIVFMSAALSQVSSAGAALGIWIAPLIGMQAYPRAFPAVFSILLALAVFAAVSPWLHKSKMPDAILALLYLAGASCTILVGTKIVEKIQDVQQLLTGNAVLVEHSDYIMMLVLTAAVFILLIYSRRALEYALFYPESAAASGVPTRTVQLAMSVVLVIVIACTARVMGALPVFALSCMPALAARNAPSLRSMFAAAAAVGAFSGFGGYFLAFAADFPVGPMQTAAAVGCAAAAGMLSFIIHLLRRCIHAKN